MEDQSKTTDKVRAKLLAAARRNALSTTGENQVAFSYLNEARLPLVIRPVVRGVRLRSWAENNRGTIEEQLLKHGGVLFRGFDEGVGEEFESMITALYGQALEYHERSSPRSRVKGNIYTSTDYPSDQSIFLHNENSYQQSWPMRIFFFCRTPPGEGGETPIADCRRVFDGIEPSIRENFAQKKWMYVRNLGDGVGLSWQTVFQTSNQSQVEEHCQRNSVTAEWRVDGRLRTRAVRPAVVRHPQTGEWVWFNHAAFFHVTTLDATVREAMQELFTEDDLPSNTYYGDGARITPAELEALRDAYRRQMVKFPWERNDVLLLDNMLVAHGRAPYSGSREILVGMAKPMSWDDMAPASDLL